MTKRKVSLKFIENDSIRKSTFKKRRAGLLKKLKELTILCDLDACAIIHGEEDTRPMVWPSPTVARDLLLRFQNIPETERRRKILNQQAYMQVRTKEIQAQVLKHKKRNNEKDMTIFMHHIYDDDKSLCDFEVSDLKRLICYVEEKLKDARKTVCHFEQSLAPNPSPPSSCPLENGVIDEQVSGQQWFLDLLEDANQMDSGDDNNTRSDMGLRADPYLGDIGMVLSEGNVKGLNGETDSALFHGNSIGEIGGNGIQLPYEYFGSAIGGSDMRLSCNCYKGNIIGNYMGIGQHNKNHGGPISNIAENNIGEWCRRKNLGGNNTGVELPWKNLEHWIAYSWIFCK